VIFSAALESAVIDELPSAENPFLCLLRPQAFQLLVQLAAFCLKLRKASAN
jgi:hypothetical protein